MSFSEHLCGSLVEIGFLLSVCLSVRPSLAMSFMYISVCVYSVFLCASRQRRRRGRRAVKVTIQTHRALIAFIWSRKGLKVNEADIVTTVPRG